MSSRAGEDPPPTASASASAPLSQSQAAAVAAQDDREEEGEAEANDEQRALLQGRDGDTAKERAEGKRGAGNEGT